MGNWDQIYKDYKKGGEAWATLSEGIIPEFKNLIENEQFEYKKALDIGCGTGKYLVYLKAQGFEVAGIDSSETAIIMSKEATGQSDNIEEVDMYEFKIPKNKFDLIYSISTIHHGTKEQVFELVNRIYGALVDDGLAFITVPDLAKAIELNYLKDDKDLGGGVFAPTSGPEKGLPHSQYTEAEIERLFSKFTSVQKEIDEIGRWIIMAKK